jgi:hypothetical protein
MNFRVKQKQCVVRMICRKSIILFLITIVVFCPTLFLQANVEILSDNSQQIKLRLKAPFPTIEQNTNSSREHSQITVTGWPTISGENKFRLPFYSTTLHLPTDKLSFSASSQKILNHKILPPQNASDTFVGPDSLNNPQNINPKIQNSDSLVTMSFLGQYRGNYLWSISFFPYQYNESTKKLVINSEIVVDLELGLQTSALQTTPKAEEVFLSGITDISHKKKILKKNKTNRLAKKAVFERWKIYVVEEGFYHITGKDLKSAGMNLLDVDMKNIRLSANGQDVPIYVKGWHDGQFDENDYFEFWGEDYKKTFYEQAADLYQDPFTSTNIYWLSWESRGQWMALEEGQISEQDRFRYIRPYSFYETVHVEQDRYYDRLSSIPIDSLRDFWFYDSGISPGRKRDYSFQLFHPDDQSPLPVLQNIMLGGRSMILSQPHRVSAFLNDSYVGTEQWQLQNFLSLETKPENQIFGSDLLHGENKMSIVNNASPDEFDIFMLNWFQVTFPRLYSAEKNFLKFTIPPNYSSGSFLFKIDGFDKEGIEVFKLGFSKISGIVIEEVTDFDDFTSTQVSFQDVVTSNKIEYIALTPDAKKKPYKIEQDEPTSLASFDIAADYILISHAKFIKNPILDELENLRQSQGHSTIRIDVQDIYDEFQYGHESPFAIKKFLNFAYENWQEPKPKFVFFVGDGSFHRNKVGRDTLDYIPVYMRQTLKFGAAASDHWYSLIDGEDEIPDLHIGRLPVRDNEQLTTAVNKIIQYETDPAQGTWKNRTLFIGGNGSIFREQAFMLQNQIPPSVESQFLFTTKINSTEYDPFFGGTADLIDYFEDGCSVMTFHGHGGGAIWADNGLLRLEDTDRLYNERKFPVVLSMTCFTGSFESPGRSSLADALLFDNEYGTMAMFGASGVGWVWNDYYLETEILKYMFSHPRTTLGEIIDGGKIAYYSKYRGFHATSQINQYHLFGDPATRLVIPKETINVELSDQTIRQGDRATLSAELPFDNGQVKINIIDSSHVVLFEENKTVTSTQFLAEIGVPDELNTSTGFVQIYAENSLKDERANGFIPFSVSGILFDSTKITRIDQDSLFFWLKLENDVEVDSLFCVCWGDTLPMVNSSLNWYKTKYGKRIEWHEISYLFFVDAANGQRVTSQYFRYTKPGQIDLQLVRNTLKMSGDSFSHLSVDVYNASAQAVENVEVIFEERQEDSTLVFLGNSHVNIAPFKTAQATVPFSVPAQKKKIKIKLANDNDPYTFNNELEDSIFVNIFNYSANNGFSFGENPIDTLIVDEQLKIVNVSQAHLENTTIKIVKKNNISIYEQPDVHWVKEAPIYNVTFGNKELQLEKPLPFIVQVPLQIIAKFDSLGQQIFGFQFESKLNKWKKLATNRIGKSFVTSISRPGLLSFFTSEDETAPGFEFTLDGQPYVEGRRVGTKPNISLLFQDVNGVDFYSDQFVLLLNGKELEEKDVTLPDSIINANHTILKITPDLDAGIHSFVFRIADCCNNVTNETELLLSVSEDFDLTMLGNYPNPFADETIFAYNLTQPCDELFLKIYTSSGRLIRDLNALEFTEDPNPLSADYHELIWDGFDENGNNVANGVYFYKIIAKQKEQSKELLGTIAKIQ